MLVHDLQVDLRSRRTFPRIRYTRDLLIAASISTALYANPLPPPRAASPRDRERVTALYTPPRRNAVGGAAGMNSIGLESACGEREDKMPMEPRSKAGPRPVDRCSVAFPRYLTERGAFYRSGTPSRGAPEPPAEGESFFCSGFHDGDGLFAKREGQIEERRIERGNLAQRRAIPPILSQS